MNQRAAHPLDKLITDNSLIMLEAMVPFVDYRLKKLLVIYIKYREFTLLMNSLNDLKFMEGCGFNKRADSTEDMMEVLLSTMSPTAAAGISNAKKMMSMMQAMDGLNIHNSDSPVSQDIFSGTPAEAQDISSPYPSDTQNNTSTSLYDSIINIIENESEF